MSWRTSASSGRNLLALGIGLRILVFPFLSPLDSDYEHLDLVKYVAEHHALFPLSANPLAFHPPRYYMLGAPFYAFTGSAKGVQLLSLLLSILTLLLFCRLLYVENLVSGEKPRMYAFLLPCFLPGFVVNSLVVSNDTLAAFFGALIVLQVVRFIAAPRNSQLLLLGVLEGLGLLSKAIFLAFLPALLVLVFFARIRQGRSAWNASLAVLALLLLSCGLGSYKFIQNYREAKNPFTSNLDLPLPWVAEQQLSYRGAASFFDVNLLKLIKSPSGSPAIIAAYPLVFYGTFW
jgi:4-amino-4-deoxy-L-arabinose transferase-like glycosyltransferase